MTEISIESPCSSGRIIHFRASFSRLPAANGWERERRLSTWMDATDTTTTDTEGLAENRANDQGRQLAVFNFGLLLHGSEAVLLHNSFILF